MQEGMQGTLVSVQFNLPCQLQGTACIATFSLYSGVLQSSESTVCSRYELMHACQVHLTLTVMRIECTHTHELLDAC